MTRAALLSALLLVACTAESGQPAAANEAGTGANTAAHTAAAVDSGAKAVKDADDLLEFSYSWPKEAGAIPPLAALLEADLPARREEARANAREDKESRPADAPFHGHYFSKAWTAHGESERLLSLSAEIGTYTGGAHGNSGFEALIWDKKVNRRLAFADLFANPPAGLAKLMPAYCEALDQARAAKRQQSLPLKGEGWMVECPALRAQSLVPADSDGDGRFDRLLVKIGPYEAGPYVEGSYELELPITDALRRLVKSDYAASF